MEISEAGPLLTKSVESMQSFCLMCCCTRWRPKEPYKDLFKKLDQKHPHAGTLWRDVHSIWQWGITDDDLELTAARLGFELVYMKWCGKWGEHFENKAFIFSR
jgi:hypothetical protein